MIFVCISCLLWRGLSLNAVSFAAFFWSIYQKTAAVPNKSRLKHTKPENFTWNRERDFICIFLTNQLQAEPQAGHFQILFAVGFRVWNLLQEVPRG